MKKVTLESQIAKQVFENLISLRILSPSESQYITIVYPLLYQRGITESATRGYLTRAVKALVTRWLAREAKKKLTHPKDAIVKKNGELHKYLHVEFKDREIDTNEHICPID